MTTESIIMNNNHLQNDLIPPQVAFLSGPVIVFIISSTLALVYGGFKSGPYLSTIDYKLLFTTTDLGLVIYI